MKKRYLWGFTGLLLCGIVGLAEAHDGYRKHSQNRLLIPPQTYMNNCGTCHTAYSALLLPSDSWKRLMGDLPNHFDAAVELDAADKEQIGAWLQGNAADTGTTRAEAKLPKKLHATRPSESRKAVGSYTSMMMFHKIPLPGSRIEELRRLPCRCPARRLLAVGGEGIGVHCGKANTDWLKKPFP